MLPWFLHERPSARSALLRCDLHLAAVNFIEINPSRRSAQSVGSLLQVSQESTCRYTSHRPAFSQLIRVSNQVLRRLCQLC